MNNETKSLGRQLYQMTLPMIIGVFAIMSNQLIDSAFIGQLGVQPLAAVGFTIPVYQLIIGIQVGIGIATTAAISQALGAKATDQAKQLGSLILTIGFILIAALCLLIWFNQEALLHLLGAQTNLYAVVREYWLPWLISSWLGGMLYFGYSIYRAYGYTKLPGMVMVLTSVLNMILDPVFIFVFDMGIAGAAWATICAFIIGCSIIYPQILAKQWLGCKLNFQESLIGLKRLLAIMGPATMSQFIPPLSAMTATVIIASYGENVIAAWGLGSRIEYFSIIIVLALTMAMPPIVGRLRGSQDFAKIDQVVKLAIGFVIAWQLLCALLIIVFAHPVATLLTSDNAVIAVVQDYLWRVPVSYGALGVCMILVSVCNAMGMSLRALIISAMRLLCFYLPFLWLGSELGGLNGLFTGAMIGNFAAGIMSWYLYKGCLEKLKGTSLSPLISVD